MPLTKEKKKELLSELDKAVSESKSVVFVHSKGLPVNESNNLRATLRANDAKFKVVKKTLLGKILEKAKVSGTKPTLDGEIGIAFGSDLLAPAREVYAFQKKHKGNITIVGGIFDGVFKSEAEMMDIATIPGLKELRGMFVNIINSPIQGFAGVLNQIAEKKS